MQQADLLDTLKHEFITFSSQIDSQTQKLREQGLVLPKDIEQMRQNTEVYKDYLSRALSDPSLDLVKRQLLQAYFSDYKDTMTRTINKFWGRLYSDDNFNKLLKESLDRCYQDFASRLSEQQSKQLDQKLAELENKLSKKFKKELNKQGEINRYQIGEDILRQELPKTLEQILASYNYQIQVQAISGSSGAVQPNEVPEQPVNSETENPSFSKNKERSSQSNDNHKFKLFQNLGRYLDDLINDICGSDS